MAPPVRDFKPFWALELPSYSAAQNCTTVWDVLTSDPQLSTFATLINVRLTAAIRHGCAVSRCVTVRAVLVSDLQLSTFASFFNEHKVELIAVLWHIMPCCTCWAMVRGVLSSDPQLSTFATLVYLHKVDR